MTAPNLLTLEQVRTEFVGFLPKLAERLAARFCRRDPETQAEAVAESIGWSWQIYLAARLKGKVPTVGNLALCSGRTVQAGRRLTGGLAGLAAGRLQAVPLVVAVARVRLVKLPAMAERFRRHSPEGRPQPSPRETI